MSEVAQAWVSLLPSAKGFGAATSRQLDPQMKSAGKRSGGFLAAGLRSAIGPAVALLGTAAVGSFLKDSIGEAREAQKVGALTTNVIKQTGGAANISAKQVGDLATAISLKTGVDDEAIQSGANLLLTFKNVANQAGKNNKIFDRATAAAADLSAAGFGDLAGTSKQLGKALNDPIKGMSALGRSGVTFTDGQKKQIAAMVKNGDLLGAQKVLLKEVESQVGGAAAATATSGEKAAVAFGNLKEQIGTALLPVVDRVASALTSKVIPAISQFISQMQSGTGAGGRFVAAFKVTGAVLTTVFGYIRTNIPPVIAFVRNLFTSITGGAGGSGARLEQFKATAISVFASVKSTIASAVSIITTLWARFGGIITSYLKNGLTNALTILRGAFAVIEGIFKTVSALLKGDWKGVWDGIKTILRGALTVIQGLIRQGMNIVKTILSGAGSAIKGAAGAAFDGIKAGAMAGWDKAKEYIKGIPQKIVSALGKMGDLLLDAGKQAISGLISGMQTAATELIPNAVKSIADKVSSGVKNALKIKSPSRVMMAIGGFVGEGLALGISASSTRVAAAASGLGAGVLAGLREGSSGLDAYLSEVSKAITGSLVLRKAELKKARPGASKKQRAQVSAFNDRERKNVAKYNDAAKAAVKSQKAAVDALGKSLAGLAGKIDTARSDLKSLQDARSSLADQTASSISGELNLTETKGKKLSFATVAANVSGLATRAKAFAGKLRGLLAAGIPAGLVQEVASLGTVQGSSVADALLSGSQQQIGQLAADYQGIDTYSKQIGDIVAGSMYDAGIAAQQGILKGLLDDAAIQGAADQLAKKLTKAVKKSLGIKSPSRVFRNEVGKYLPQGIVAGIDDGQRALDRRVAGMVSVASIGKVQPGDFGGGVSASAPIQVNQTINPLPGQSDQEIGDAAANRLMFAMMR